uniref:Mitochondrial import inner membrane translocase subunit n=1 Tax=Xenopus tropicalis TaxID=8364 RepID=A0A803JXV8_XENTR
MDPLKAQQLAAELEVEMMADMYNRMTGACHKKCVPPHYKEAELSKGESVCLDRCVSKYLDIHERMGKKLTELSLQDEELMRKMQQGVGAAFPNNRFPNDPILSLSYRIVDGVRTIVGPLINPTLSSPKSIGQV